MILFDLNIQHLAKNIIKKLLFKRYKTWFKVYALNLLVFYLKTLKKRIFK